MNSTTDLDLRKFGAREILQLLPDGAYICDRDRRIVFWNDAAARITGWTSDHVVGKHCRDNILVHIDKDGHPLCGSAWPQCVRRRHATLQARTGRHGGQLLAGIARYRDDDGS